jgi:YebC/PmpR family DNA-binding regulatory protein
MGRAFEVRKMSMAKTAGQKTKLYSKYARQLYTLAKNSGPDPEANSALRGMIDRAKREQVPSHVIERALEKASGAGGEDFAAARYEGYGPGGCSVIVECLTDNPTRTITDVRNAFNKTGAKLGAQGSASHTFDHLAVFSFAGDNEEAVLEAMLEAEVEVTDVECEDGKLTVFAPASAFFEVKQALLAALPEIELEVEQITYLPQARIEIAESDVAMFEKLLAMLDDSDDVQEVYHNAVLPS